MNAVHWKQNTSYLRLIIQMNCRKENATESNVCASKLVLTQFKPYTFKSNHFFLAEFNTQASELQPLGSLGRGGGGGGGGGSG